MVLYICSLCNKKFNHKGDYTRHINRKNKCKIIPSNNNNENPNEKKKITLKSGVCY